MCRAMEEMRDKAASEATLRNTKKIALKLLVVDDSYEKIALVTDLSIEEIKELDKLKMA